MAADQQFCLRWNNHQSTLISVFDTLLESETLVDCTLAAEGQYLKAHKVVLSACSPYLEVLLSQHYEKHPIVILKDVKFQELKSMMDYMYRGEVNISQDQLGTFLKAAESLQIKGLSDGGGGENDSRDVGSTPATPKRHDLPRKVPPSVPPVPQPRNPSLLPHSQSNSGLSIEPRRPVPQHVSDSAPESPSHRSREGSISPSLRKRRRTRRLSQGDDSNLDSHIDTSNSCDLPNQAQSTPLSTGIVPSIPASMTPLVPPSTITKPPPIETEQNLQTDTLNRLDNSNSLPPESGLIKEKIEPTNEGLLEPKTEYMDDINNEDSVEDLTLDDDDEEMEGMDMARPGPSHGGDGSNQGFAPWHMTGNQSGSDEVFMAAQEAVGAAHRDSQDNETQIIKEDDIKEIEKNDFDETEEGSVQEIKKTEEYSVQKTENGDFIGIDQETENGDFRGIDQETENGDFKDIETGGIDRIEEGAIATRTRKIKTTRMPLRFENFYTKEIPKVTSNQKKTIFGGKIKNKSPIIRRGKQKNMMKRLLNKSEEEVNGMNPFMKKIKTCEFCCSNCGALYQHKASLVRHQKFECGIEPQFFCALCDYRGKHKGSLKKHIINIHLPINWDVEVDKDMSLMPKQRKRPGRKPKLSKQFEQLENIVKTEGVSDI